MEIAEPTITCPYNKAHSIISSRMQFHLAKCRLQYPDAEKTTCPFNSTHIVNKVELPYHTEFCPDRIVLDAFTCKIGTSSVPKVELSKVDKLEITGDEDWTTNEESSSVSVLDRVHEISKTKPTLQALIGAPKSERKAFRNQERLRIQRVLDSKETVGEGSGITNPVESSRTTRKVAESRMVQYDEVSENTKYDEACGITKYDEACGLDKYDEACGITQHDEASVITMNDEGTGIKTERRRNGYKVEVPKGRSGVIYSGCEPVASNRITANQGQKTNFENAKVIQKSSGGVTIRDPKSPWGIPKQSDTIRSPQSGIRFPQNDIRFPQNDHFRSPQMGSPMPTQIGAVRSTQNFPGLNAWGNNRGESVATLATAFAEANISPQGPPRGRDPGNPWKVSKAPSTATTSESPSNPNDFPMLPVAGRGRGRNRAKNK